MKDAVDVFLRGGGQEKGIRSGTENVLGAVAFSWCLERYYNKDNSLLKKMDWRSISKVIDGKGEFLCHLY